MDPPLLSRAATRQKELSFRLSLGATRARLVRQLLTESLLLATMGGALGMLVGRWSQQLLPVTAGRVAPLDWRVLTFVLAVTGLTGVMFVELNGASPEAPSLASATPPGRVPEIVAEKSSLSTAMEQLPRMLERFSAIEGQLPEVIAKFSQIENQTKKVLSDVGEVTAKVKENPSLLLRPPKDKDKDAR